MENTDSTTKNHSWLWDKLDDYLAAHELKQTKQRRLIIQNFLNLDTHVDAETLYESLRNQGNQVGLATIYRTLNLLKSADLVEQHDFADGRAMFEVRVPEQHHDHLICLSCGKIVEFENNDIEDLQQQVAESHSMSLVDHKLELYGHCIPACC